MKRDMIKIDEDLCNGCGLCVPECHEGALQIIDGKVRLVSDLMCDGLGACLGHCPQGALEIEQREAAPYNETEVIKEMIAKGKNTIIAHLKHLKDHKQTDFVKEGVTYLKSVESELPFELSEIINAVHGQPTVMSTQHQGGGCPGSRTMTFNKPEALAPEATGSAPSELRQWPVQLHLLSPMAPYFKEADVVLAADCVAFAMGNFHDKFLKGKSLAIACPKLDSNQDIYREKLTALINDAKINTLSVVIMQVPCCGGLLQTARMAVDAADRKIPLKVAIISVEGAVLEEKWV